MSSKRITGTVLGLALGLAATFTACGEDPARPDARLEGDVAEVRGTVVLETGAGLPGATIDLTRNGVVSRSAKSGSDGRYAIGVPEAGTWELRLKPPVGYALPPDVPGTISLDVAAGEVVTLDLEAAYNLTVSVGVGTAASPDTVGGEPGVPVWVRVAGESTLVASDATGAQGFVPFALPPGVYDVGIDVPAGFTLNPKTPNPRRVELVDGVPQGVGFFLIRD